MTLTATVTDVSGNPANGAAVTFTVLKGPDEYCNGGHQWRGDGSSSTLHVIIDRHGNLFLVTGVHTYVKKGTYQITLTIQDVGGSSVTTTRTITIK